MDTSAVRIVLVGHILKFYTPSAGAAVADEDILNHVLSELSDLKVKVNTCEEKLAEVDDRVPFSDDQLRLAEFYVRRFAKMEDMLLAAEYKLKTTEKNYEKKLATIENKLKAFEKLFQRLDGLGDRFIANEHKDNRRTFSNDNKSGKKNPFYSQTELNSTKTFKNEKLTKTEEKNASETKDKRKGAKDEFPILNSGKHMDEDTTKLVINHSGAEIVEAVSKRSNAPAEIPLPKRLLGPAVSRRVAFTAVLSDHVSGLGKAQTIPFDQVLLNEGGAYDPVLHVFICPVDGIYMFQSAVNCVQNKYMQTEMVKDGTTLVRMYSSGATGSDGYDQGFNAAIVQCNSGERVWVRVHHVFGTAIFSWNYSSFSGFILWET